MAVKVLAIETSCDETAVSVLSDNKEVLFNKLWSQDHSSYGGVVPEIASRNHLEILEKMICSAINISDFSHVAVTGGPGLIGGLLVGVMMAKGIASAAKKKFIAINHLEGHILSARIDHDVHFPFLVLLVSGGHCQIIIAEGIGKYKVIGKTLDDALGETFDKVAKMLDLEYPGGPKIENLSKIGNQYRFNLVKPMYRRDCCDFSFSGLKTAVKQLIVKLGKLSNQDKCDLCSSFQRVICEILIDRIVNAIRFFKRFYSGSEFIIAGGVAANAYIRTQLKQYVESNGLTFLAPRVDLCTDNAIMIGWAAIERIRNNVNYKTPLDFSPKARWSLEDLE
ncbi:MAG: tRNA (adenosine(37)-N6)-threonylcarbamoyltransferase complex transferase subunit TsaD [Rickettsiaceae bacterium H1]|nr:tRNA (adenosine(37)-N6)-threonylcarbamoyltransferase complex transferase subunit TsaD [Rickettsiaceae bacterium H1]